MSKRAAFVFYALIALFFGVFFLWPIGRILAGGFFDPDGVFTLAYVREVFANPLYLEGLRNAFLLAVFSTLGALLIAVPLAWVADRFAFWGKGLWQTLALLPLLTPPFVGALGVRQLFGVSGALNALLMRIKLLDTPVDWLADFRFAGMAALLALSLYPVLYLTTLAALSNCDPTLEEAAENLGCRSWEKFRKITLPLAMPGVFSGGILVFIWSFTELGVPLLFDYARIAPVQVFNALGEIGYNPFPYALVSVLLVCALVLYALGRLLFGRKASAMLAKAASPRVPRRVRGWRAWLCAAMFAAVVTAALLPHAAVLIISFTGDWYDSLFPQTWTLRNYAEALGGGLGVESVRNSLLYSAGATVVALFLGGGIAYMTVRTRLPGRKLLDGLSMLPLAVPGLVLAFGYLAMTGKGEFFSFLDPVENPTALLVIAYAVRRLPFMVRCLGAGFEQVSPAYEEAAQNLGCPPLRALRKVTFPLIGASVMAGTILVFSQSMLEVSDSLLLAQKQAFYPITKAIYELANYLGEGPFLACALGMWALAFLATAFAGAGVLLGRGLGRLFSAK